MYALHLAVNSIRAGDCDSAIVASANWIADPNVQIALDKLGALSSSSRCHTFDAKGDGYARGEGYAAIYLKRPSKAMTDGSPIRGVIRGTSMNSNGRTGGITRPSAAGQEAVIREAYRSAGNLPFTDTDYFECHGTGTYVGDPIEVTAIGNVFANERNPSTPLLVGSVKSNLGHTGGASALASIMKVVLALERGVIPPIYKLETLNPNIPFEKANIKPVTALTPWPRDNLRRASINSFGYGDANAHCIIDHVSLVLPDYVAPGLYRKHLNGAVTNDKNLDSTSREANGHTNGHTNGHMNGATNGVTNGHRNGQAVSHETEHMTKQTNDRSYEHTLCHENGYTNGHANGIADTSCNANGYGKGQLVPKHRPVVDTPKLNSVFGATTRQLVLLVLSAHNENSLRLNIDALSGAIDKFPLADVAFTLNSKRSKFPQRSFRIVDKDNIAKGLREERKLVRAPLEPSRLGFIFTGQGAQWHGMAAGLFEYKTFRNVIKYLDHVLASLPSPPTWTLLDVLSGNCEPDFIQKPTVSQATCTGVQIGLVDLLASWSVRPSAVAGHSSGEMAAAYASGRITAAEAIVTAYFRGQAVERNRKLGQMMAVGVGVDQASKYLLGKQAEIRVAAVNSPGSVTLSGEVDAINEVAASLSEAGIFNRVLQTGGNAYHSHHMAALGQDFEDMLQTGLEHLSKSRLIDSGQRYPVVPWCSSVTPSKKMPENGVGISYWRNNLESPVYFSDAVTNMVNVDTPVQAFVEIGPHPALKSPLEQIAKAVVGKPMQYAATLKRQEDGRESVLSLAGTLFGFNASINLVAVNAVDNAHGVTCIDLPPYQYTYGDILYHESRASKEQRYRPIPRHDLLGSKVVGTAKLRPQWRNLLRIKDVPWLGHHKLLPDAVLPGAGYIAIAIEAAKRIHDEYPETTLVKGFSLRNVSIKSALRIPEDDFGVVLNLHKMGKVYM